MVDEHLKFAVPVAQDREVVKIVEFAERHWNLARPALGHEG